MFKAVLGLEGIVSKKLNEPYKSGPSKAWLKIKNPKEPASTRIRWDVLVNRKFIDVILLGVAVPVYAHAQNPRVSKGDAEKVATIISGDKAKTQTYCDMQKLAEQIQKANENKDSKMVDELFQKLETMEKTLGPEYIALIDGIQEIAENDELRVEFLSSFGALVRMCTK